MYEQNIVKTLKHEISHFWFDAKIHLVPVVQYSIFVFGTQFEELIWGLMGLIWGLMGMIQGMERLIWGLKELISGQKVVLTKERTDLRLYST